MQSIGYDANVSDFTNHPISDQNKPAPQQPSHMSARVPERVARGVYSTGQIILDGPREFVIDFLQGLTRPYQVVARIVMTPGTAMELSKAIEANLENYTRNFGPPPTVPTPPQERKPTLQEFYDHYKVADDMLSGSYSNAVLIGHNITDFFLDFITGFAPNPAVSSRVFLPAPQVPRFLTALNGSIKQYQTRTQQNQNPGTDPPPPPSPAG